MGVRTRVSSNVRRQRIEIGITQAELATRVGVDRAYISALERGLYNPTIERVEQIALALGVDVSILFALAVGEHVQRSHIVRKRKTL